MLLRYAISEEEEKLLVTELKYSRFEHKRGEFLGRKTPVLPRVFSRHGEKRREIRRGCMGVFAPKNVPTYAAFVKNRSCPTHTKKITLKHFPTLKPHKNQPSSERTGKTVYILLLRTSLYYRYYFAVHNGEKLISKCRTSHAHKLGNY